MTVFVNPFPTYLMVHGFVWEIEPVSWKWVNAVIDVRWVKRITYLRHGIHYAHLYAHDIIGFQTGILLSLMQKQQTNKIFIKSIQCKLMKLAFADKKRHTIAKGANGLLIQISSKCDSSGHPFFYTKTSRYAYQSLISCALRIALLTTDIVWFPNVLFEKMMIRNEYHERTWFINGTIKPRCLVPSSYFVHPFHNSSLSAHKTLSFLSKIHFRSNLKYTKKKQCDHFISTKNQCNHLFHNPPEHIEELYYIHTQQKS